MRRIWGMLLLVLLLGGRPGLGWETGVMTKLPIEDQWLSLYIHRGARPTPGTSTGFNDNEHAEISDLALRNLGVGKLYSMSEGRALTVIDLNASLFRPELQVLERLVDTPSGTKLEERTLPPPPHFTGIPDFSWTLYDWINKNALCPTLPLGTPQYDLCHSFKGWMGALNATHFGSQAAKIYQHLHKVAVARARVARDMRKKLEVSAVDLAEHADYAREAEFMALAFEAVAQHYLQDRWSTGHMWERWNASNHKELAYPDFLSNSLIGAASGLLHGSESITGLPDPVCSPAIIGGMADPIRAIIDPQIQIPRGVKNIVFPAKWCRKTHGPVDGVGDHRLMDMFDGHFGKEFKVNYNLDYAIDVATQSRQMMDCSMSGWAEVIQAFGRYKNGYGIDQAQLESTEVDFSNCWNMWLTNFSVKLGYGGVAETLADYARLEFGNSLLTKIVKGGLRVNMGRWITSNRNIGINRTEWLSISWRVWKEGFFRPKEFGLATGGIGSFGKAKPGNTYKTPDYLEPIDLDTLPERVEKFQMLAGRDKQTLYGFFNRATTGYWCANMEKHLRDLRGSDDDMKLEACRYLADRVYRGTDPEYMGRQQESRRQQLRMKLVTTDNTVVDSPQVNPVCWHFGIKANAVNEDLPVYLEPGYVGRPYRRTKEYVTAQSLANWCEAIPLLKLDPRSNADDLVATVYEGSETAAVSGLNLGDPGGQLFIAGQAAPIHTWSASSVVFGLPKKLSPGDHLLKIKRIDDEKESVGRFVLRVTEKPKEAETELGKPGEYDTGVTWKSDAGDCSALRDQWHKKCYGMGERYKRERCRPRKPDGTPLTDDEWKKKPGGAFSGCAWAVGCMGTYIDSAFSDQYCDKPGYTACTTGLVQAYYNELESINKQLIAGQINEHTATKKRIEQQGIIKKGIDACRYR